jgi:metallo-beta-lactamase family protein
VIPTFAVERAQELMYYISQLAHENQIPDIPIFLDSPMAIDVTAIFQKFKDYFDMATWLRAISNHPPLRFPGLKMCRSVRDSQSINKVNTPCIIMSTAGMCTAGRIKHHLRHNIGRPECCIMFVGYQGEGTLGRQIVEGRDVVRIHGRDWRVRARVAQIYGFSGHADRADLLRWIGHFNSPPRHVFLTHGDEESANSLAGHIGGEMKWPVSVPAYQDVVELE